MAKVQPLLGCAAASVLVFGMAAPAVAAPGDIITLSDSSLSASGGLAADPVRQVYWTAAGSGVVQAISPDGSTAGEVHFDATPTDVEALAMYQGALYVGDVGGNRAAVNVYRLNSMDFGVPAPFTEWTMHYPDGSHEAQTMMVSPRGNIWIITEGSPGGLYYVQPIDGVTDLTLEYIGEAPDWVTDGVFIDGSTAVLRTYNSVLTYDMMNYAVTAAEAAPEQPQGESVTTTLDSTGVVLGSRDDDRLLQVVVPTVLDSVSPAPSAPPGAHGESPTDQPSDSGEEQTPDPTGEATATDSPEPKADGSNGTIGAIGIAALISVVAGGIVYMVSKPQSKRYKPRH